MVCLLCCTEIYMKHLNIYIVVSYLLGIYYSSRIEYDNLCVLFISSIIALAVIFIRRHRFSVALIAFAFALGSFWTTIYNNPKNSELHQFEDCYVTVTGKICDLPTQSTSTGNFNYTLKISEFQFDGKNYPIKSKIRFSTPVNYKYADIVSAKGFLKLQSPPSSIGVFDYQTYYRSKNINYNLFSTNNYTHFIRSDYRISSIFDIPKIIQDKYCKFINQNFDNDTASMLLAINMGITSYFSADMYDTLLITGMSRIFNSAYINIIYITAVMTVISELFRLSSLKRRIFSIILLTAILIIQPYHITNLKAVVLYICCEVYLRRYGFLYFPDVLTAVIGIFLLLNPLLAYNPAFVMSVSSTILLALFKQPLTKRLLWIRPKFVRNILTVWIILTLGLIPMSAYFFNGTNLYAIIISTTLTPIILAIKFITPLLFIKNNIIILTILKFLVSLIYFTIDSISVFKGFRIPLPTPAIHELLLYICMVTSLKFFIDKDIARHYFKKSILACLIFTVFISYEKISALGTVDINIVNVGQGDAAILSVPYHEKILIDGGGNNEYSSFNAGEYIFVPYLEHKGINEIDIAIVSHYHSDHANGIISAFKNTKIKQLIMPDCMPDNKIRQTLEKLAKDSGTEIIYPTLQKPITLKSGLTITFMSPDKSALNSKDENDTSIVTDISYGGFKMLFTGDITSEIEHQLIKNNLLSDYDVIKLAHHGASSSTSDDFLTAVTPEYAVISVGEDNDFAHPASDVLNRLALHNVRILRTDKLGDITLTADKNGLKRITYFKDGE